MLRRPAVADVVSAADAAEHRAVERALSAYEATENHVKAELARVAFSNLGDYFKVGSDGKPRLCFDGLTRDQLAALAEITVDEVSGSGVTIDQGGEPVEMPVVRVRFKLHDKMGALNSLARILGMFVDRHEHAGPGGVPLEPPRFLVQFVDSEAAE